MFSLFILWGDSEAEGQNPDVGSVWRKTVLKILNFKKALRVLGNANEV